jgi:tRNA(fMet)-specific endonuclease VapC
MIAFDADVLSLILAGDAELSQRASGFPPQEQTVPIVVIEEIIRGRLNSIRQAEAGKGSLAVDRAYDFFEATVTAFREIKILSYTSHAEKLYQECRSRKVRIGTHDLRIAAICVAHSVMLVSRNRRDFDQLPGLHVEYWG